MSVDGARGGSSAPMNVCAWHDLPSGGGRRAFEDHCEGLVARGHRLTVVTPARDETKVTLPAGVDVIELPVREPGAIGRTNLPNPHIVLSTLLGHEWHYRKVARAVARIDADVFWVNSSRRVRCPDLAGRVAAPSVLYLQEPYRWFYEALPALPWVERPLWRPRHFARNAAWRLQARTEITAARGYDRVLVNSRFSRESVLRAYGVEARVCRLGVNVDRFEARPRNPDGHVISLGALVPEKRHLEIVEALGAMNPEIRPELKIVANVSEPAYEAQVRAAGQTRGVDLNIEIGVSDERLKDVLSTALAMVYCPRLEPLGLAPLEAAAMGVPVVAVAEGGVRETVLDGVTGVLVDDSSEVTAALTRVLTDRSVRAQLGANGPGYVRDKWSVERAVDVLVRELRAAIDNASGAVETR